ncbi:amino acid ABC transporter permease [Rhizobium halophytocola]|uniref:His/Glu/Gln/Arg/opine family amino acid ABC transporter permease subunit n=1 Tax=Rhizobium halophytocola TaxID=735519 RepID=A0ABS4DUM0_9HYPH|nr:amino acid ABC transporter permease [Rhizobium halophytocola]MBP1849367.1 His/Glu/Gln/Arg/opine family amino acid ABC transporter permease subunit [Rhizobium halophytocola]
MDFSLFTAYTATLLHGILMTIALMLVVGTLAPLLALPLALGREYGPAWMRWSVNGFSWLMRAVPTLVLLFFAYFGLPALGIYLPPMLSALVALVISAMGYNVEFLAAGLRAVPEGQIEACRALGLRRNVMIWKVVLPQALPIAIPPLFSNLTLNLKGTSLAGLVAVPEFMATISGLISETYRPVEFLLLAAVVYLALNSLLIGLQGVAERRFSPEWKAQRAERIAKMQAITAGG